MDPELRAKLEALNFRPTGYGGMSVRVEDVRYTAVEHPPSRGWQSSWNTARRVR